MTTTAASTAAPTAVRDLFSNRWLLLFLAVWAVAAVHILTTDRSVLPLSDQEPIGYFSGIAGGVAVLAVLFLLARRRAPLDHRNTPDSEFGLFRRPDGSQQSGSIVGGQSGRCIDINGGSTANGTRAQPLGLQWRHQPALGLHGEQAVAGVRQQVSGRLGAGHHQRHCDPPLVVPRRHEPAVGACATECGWGPGGQPGPQCPEVGPP